MPKTVRNASAREPDPSDERGDLSPAPQVETYGDFQLPELDLFRETGDMNVLSDAAFTDWSWIIYYLRTPDEMARLHTKEQRVLITKLVGPLDILQVQGICGGGSFEIRGTFEGRLRARLRIDLAGPKKDYNAPVAPTPAAVQAFAMRAPRSRLERHVLRTLRRQGQVLEQLVARAGTPATPAAPGAQGITLTDIINLADKLAQRQNPAPEANTLNTVVDAFKQGMSLAQELGGGPERTQTEIIMEKAMPVAERLLGAILTGARRRQPAPTPRPGSPPAPDPSAAVPGEAHVVEPESPPDLDTVRMMGAVDALARAIEARRPPEEFAATLEDLLSPDQLSVLLFSPQDEVIGSVLAAAPKYPVLAGDGARAYLTAVLTTLKAEPEGEADPS